MTRHATNTQADTTRHARGGRRAAGATVAPRHRRAAMGGLLALLAALPGTLFTAYVFLPVGSPGEHPIHCITGCPEENRLNQAWDHAWDAVIAWPGLMFAVVLSVLVVPLIVAATSRHRGTGHLSWVVLGVAATAPAALVIAATLNTPGSSDADMFSTWTELVDAHFWVLIAGTVWVWVVAVLRLASWGRAHRRLSQLTTAQV